MRKVQASLIHRIGVTRYQILENMLCLPQQVRSYPLPSSYYTTVKDWLTISNGQECGTHLLGCQSAKNFIRKLPNSINDSIHSSFLKEERRKGQDIFAYEIPEARIWGSQGTVITGDNHILVELSPEFRESPEQFNVFQQSYLETPEYLSGKTILLAAPAGQVYGHWMMDVLPRLGVLERLGVDWKRANHYFVNGTHIPFQKRSLELLGIPIEKCISGSRLPHIMCERLIAPSLPGLSGNMPDWAVSWLREKFLPFAKDPGFGPRVYITRKAGGRNVANEPELIAELSKVGFKPIVLEKLSFEEQIGVFSNADIVIGGNGSGMFNLVFCSPDTKVIELFSDASVNVCQWAAGQHALVDYGYLVGQSIDSAEDVHPHCLNYKIDINDIIKLLSN